MPSLAKSQSARANGAKSRGPATEAGKQRSSQNAIRHGLTAQTLVLPCEDPADYQRLLDSYLDYFHPSSPVELDLVQEMVAAKWRLNRTALIETQLLADSIAFVDERHEEFSDDDEPPLTPAQALAKGFDRMSATSSFLYRIQSRLERAYSRALRTLLQLQKLRPSPGASEPDPATAPEPSANLHPTPQPPAAPPSIFENENCTNEPTAPSSPIGLSICRPNRVSLPATLSQFDRRVQLKPPCRARPSVKMTLGARQGPVFRHVEGYRGPR